MNRDLGPGKTYNGITVWSNDTAAMIREQDIRQYYQKKLSEREVEHHRQLENYLKSRPCIRCQEYKTDSRINFCAGCGKDVRSFWRKLWQRLNLKSLTLT